MYVEVVLNSTIHHMRTMCRRGEVSKYRGCMWRGYYTVQYITWELSVLSPSSTQLDMWSGIIQKPDIALVNLFSNPKESTPHILFKVITHNLSLKVDFLFQSFLVISVVNNKSVGSDFSFFSLFIRMCCCRAETVYKMNLLCI